MEYIWVSTPQDSILKVTPYHDKTTQQDTTCYFELDTILGERHYEE